ncbi:SDR family oxidoreductase [Nesterenkonia halotolerans]|uniref:NAD(P)-dependent dehydrogenase (Short-subunit alcohol dehydrogenase family) n=1 Tax=Nesterenkonia halotolerans TaxID=225325 RepID=A0ABR9J965_9MICC|nr:SDR family oxidoreductase [Nesterenkonia halotolerans]MBE1515535.1 NAD(P)-dependent dehydrogenase (short-subunit alcohol dehydrogenase family) [Nesterenkonia halotolerans]
MSTESNATSFPDITELQGTQLAFDDPTTRHSKISPPKQDQSEPGLEVDADPVPDIGLETYRGLGRLQGRKALVTGGDSGIGAATAIAFAREGADVAIAYLPAEGKDAERVISAIEGAGRTAVALPGDLMDKQYRDSLADSAAEKLGGLDILVNNAGKQIVNDSLEELTDEQVDEAFQINIKSMYTLTRAALKHMGPGSTIVNSTSIQAYAPNPMLLDYAATKAAINNFTKGLAQQLAPRGIRVNAVAPGPVWTIIQPTEGQPKEKLPEFGHDTPLGRPGQPVEMAPAFVFLASPESSYVTGETLNANGGTPTA